MKTTIKFDKRKFMQGMEATQKKIGHGTARLLAQEARKVMAQSAQQCPTTTGTLVSAAFVQERRQRGPVSQVQFGYKGAVLNPMTGAYTGQYMIKQHEDLTLHHDNGKAKFLEDPILDYARQEAEASIGKGINKILKL